MGVIRENAELAILDALSRRPLPDDINIPLCCGGPLELTLTEALEAYVELRRSGSDAGILAQRPDLLALIDELLERRGKSSIHMTIWPSPMCG